MHAASSFAIPGSAVRMSLALGHGAGGAAAAVPGSAAPAATTITQRAGATYHRRYARPPCVPSPARARYLPPGDSWHGSTAALACSSEPQLSPKNVANMIFIACSTTHGSHRRADGLEDLVRKARFVAAPAQRMNTVRPRCAGRPWATAAVAQRIDGSDPVGAGLLGRRDLDRLALPSAGVERPVTPHAR